MASSTKVSIEFPNISRIHVIWYVKFRLAYAAYASFISQKTLTQPYAHQSFAYAKDSHDKPTTKLNRDVLSAAHVKGPMAPQIADDP